MTSLTIRIVIADDHPIFRKGLRQILESDACLEIVGEADEGLAALSIIESSRPDVAVLDIDMPGADGLQAARLVRDRRLPTRVIVLTMHKDDRFLNAALDAGVQGYVVKDGALPEIVTAIKTVAEGRHYVSSALTTLLLARRQRRDELIAASPGVDGLTSTERQVLALIAEFMTTKQIAARMCISPRTVDHHRANISEKLGLKGSHALTRFAVEHRSVLVDRLG